LRHPDGPATRMNLWRGPIAPHAPKRRYLARLPSTCGAAAADKDGHGDQMVPRIRLRTSRFDAHRFLADRRGSLQFNTAHEQKTSAVINAAVADERPNPLFLRARSDRCVTIGALSCG
jgi:hypothetical protein